MRVNGVKEHREKTEWREEEDERRIRVSPEAKFAVVYYPLIGKTKYDFV